MNQRIIELQVQIKEAQKEIEEIRIVCPHTETYIGLTENWKNIVGADICTECGKVIGLNAAGDPVYPKPTFARYKYPDYPYDTPTTNP